MINNLIDNCIFECVVGSTAYGTSIEGVSDVDIKGVYCQDPDEILGLKYREQINVDKDTTFYEISRFIDLLGSANPTVLEMLFVDDRFVNHIHPAFQIVRDNRHKFLTKNCAKSFGGYAIAQIKKAKGLDKKMNWETERIERKTILDFCMVADKGKSFPVKDWLNQFSTPTSQESIGLCKLDKMPNCYGIYVDIVGNLGYWGIAGEDSNDVRLSSIPKDEPCIGVMSFNKDAYSIHCKEYREYQAWLSNRNKNRYVDTETHGQQIDGKNIGHCVRLIDCALEIAQERNLSVFRPNREELLNIRLGKCNLEQVIADCEEKLAQMDALFADSDLPESVSLDFKHDLILEVRSKM